MSGPPQVFTLHAESLLKLEILEFCFSDFRKRAQNGLRSKMRSTELKRSENLGEKISNYDKMSNRKVNARNIDDILINGH